jgi:hypothetical protein
MTETRLRIARWQVAQQKRMIAEQRMMISRLRAVGLPTDDAETFLRQMYDDLAFRQRAISDSEVSRESALLH